MISPKGAATAISIYSSLSRRGAKLVGGAEPPGADGRDIVELIGLPGLGLEPKRERGGPEGPPLRQLDKRSAYQLPLVGQPPTAVGVQVRVEAPPRPDLVITNV